MKKFHFLLIALLLGSVFLTSGSLISWAATMHTIDITDLPTPSGIETFTLWYTVSDDFSLPEQPVLGNAIPSAAGNFGWLLDSWNVGDNVGDKRLTLAASNWDFLMADLENPMLNGIIGTMQYNGEIKGLELHQFGDKAGNPLPILFRGLDESGTHFSYIPIPSTLLLLGSGVLGVVALRRRMRG